MVQVHAATDEAAQRTEAAAATRECLPRRNWGWFMARGVLLVVLGVVAFASPGPALVAFALVFAAFSFVDGVMAIASGISGARGPGERWWPLMLSGAAGIAVGVLFVLFPLVSTFAYALATVILIAAWAVATGVLEIAAAIRLRKEIEGEWLLAAAGALSVLLGLALAALIALQPGITTLSVAWLIGFYAVVSGVALIGLGFRLRRKREAPVPAT